MKKMAILLVMLGMLSGAFVPGIYAAPEDPIDYDNLPEITYEEMDGEFEVLAITKDGYLIIRYKGKIYIYEPKRK